MPFHKIKQCHFQTLLFIRLRPASFQDTLLLKLLAGLVAYGAGSLTSRLAGGLALATSALNYRFLKISGLESLDMLHDILLG